MALAKAIGRPLRAREEIGKRMGLAVRQALDQLVGLERIRGERVFRSGAPQVKVVGYNGTITITLKAIPTNRFRLCLKGRRAI